MEQERLKRLIEEVYSKVNAILAIKVYRAITDSSLLEVKLYVDELRDIPDEVRHCYKKEGYVSAIRLYRDITKCHLKEAINYVKRACE